MNRVKSMDFRPRDGVVVIVGDDGTEMVLPLAGLGPIGGLFRGEQRPDLLPEDGDTDKAAE
jgi:hypothetical protein